MLEKLIKEEKEENYKNLLFKCKTSAIHNFYTSKIRHLLQLRWKNKLFEPPQFNNWEELQNQIEELSSQRKNGKYKNYFITITTQKKKDISEFKIQILKLFKSALIDKGKLVIEQRGDTPETIGKGLHAHILAIRNPNKYTHSKFTDRFLARIVKLGLNDTYKSPKNMLRLANLKNSTFSYQNIKDETIASKIDYMKGLKNEEKLGKVNMDKQFRTQNKIKHLYEK